ncbi:MAG: DNA polymerase III subunit gamma/tau [Clostridia bacterium]|nr:DNA polymerase III subunit gamma/tau [Clostridia bacterium]
MHQALYRKWRPRTFSEVCGQEHITSILKQEATEGRFNHAYLFCGSRGTGKTTCAKILSKVVNCENVVNGEPCGKCPSCLAIENGSTTDVLEMDAASNNGVDNIRDIRDEVVYSPSFLKYRVYIVDEVHMLSNSAFNALLKTLEEPPSHAIFILATTELHKLPATIVSRCQRFEFRRIATDILTSRIKYIADQEKIAIDDDAARLIARYSQGGMRDSISLLELCASSGEKIDVHSVNETIGSAGRERMMDVARAIADKNFEFLFGEIDAVVTSSKDITVFWQDLISLYRDLLVVKTVRESAKYLDLTDFEAKALSALAEKFSREMLIYHCRMLEEALYSMQASGAVKRIIAELCFVKMCDDTLSTSNEALLLRLSKLEARVASGVPAKALQDKPEQKKEPVKKVDARAENEKKAVTFTQEPVREIKKAPVSADARSVKPLKAWSEAVQTIQSVDKGAYPFLKKTRAYIGEDNRIHVLNDGFSLFAIDRPDIKSALAAALSRYLERSVMPSDIIYEQDMGKIRLEDDNSDLDAFDDFMNN